VLEQCFDLMDSKDHTLQEVSRYFNVTHERICRVEAKVLRKLRQPALRLILRNYLGQISNLGSSRKSGFFLFVPFSTSMCCNIGT
jgi:hypothetical protein